MDQIFKETKKKKTTTFVTKKEVKSPDWLSKESSEEVITESEEDEMKNLLKDFN